MAGFRVVASEVLNTLGQRFHGIESLSVSEDPRGERPHIAKRHRAEAPGSFATLGLDLDPDIEVRRRVEGDAAELDRRAIDEFFVAMFNRNDANVRAAC